MCRLSKIALAVLFAVALGHSGLMSQEQRIRAMGGLTLAVHDSDYSLNPYDFARNPAWLREDEKTDWLKVLPSGGGEWGGLRRRFDAASTLQYGAGFDGVKNLYDKGTFRGSASYGVETRRDVYRSLNRSPYAGEAFFVTDTTTGDFTYNGPTVQFQYSYGLFSSFTLGASVRYQLLNGLKDIYSRTKSLYRDLQASVGATFEAGDGWVFGLAVEPWDNQESMEAQSEESFEVELFTFRGDTYSTRHRSTTIDHKVRKKGIDYAGEVYFRPSPGLEIGAVGRYGASKTQVLVPKGLEKEVEEGLARPSQWDARLQARLDASSTVTLGAMVRYHHARTWSQHSALGLLLWDWTQNELGAGAGVSFRPLPALLTGVEYEFARTEYDSLKYIDDLYQSGRPFRHLVRFGLEYEIAAGAAIRLGGQYQFAAKDLVTGATDLAGFGISAGGGMWLSQSVRMDVFFEYGSTAPLETGGAVRGSMAGGVNLKLLSL